MSNIVLIIFGGFCMKEQQGFYLCGIFKNVFTKLIKSVSGDFSQEILQIEYLADNGQVFLLEVIVRDKSIFDYKALDFNTWVSLPVFIISTLAKNGRVYQNIYLR